MFEKYSTIRFYKNPSSKSRVVPSGEGQTNMAKLIVAFRNFAKVSKSCLPNVQVLCLCNFANNNALSKDSKRENVAYVK